VRDPELDDLLRKVLALSPEARAAIAGSLLDSLDGPVEEGAAAEGEAEIARRIVQLDSCAVTPIPWSEVRRSLLHP
jgi:putative addiction module component (TIGR02574 family)